MRILETRCEAGWAHLDTATVACCRRNTLKGGHPTGSRRFGVHPLGCSSWLVVVSRCARFGFKVESWLLWWRTACRSFLPATKVAHYPKSVLVSSARSRDYDSPMQSRPIPRH